MLVCILCIVHLSLPTLFSVGILFVNSLFKGSFSLLLSLSLSLEFCEFGSGVRQLLLGLRKSVRDPMMGLCASTFNREGED
jgi:hypothetical protein